jgi:hypothetical protein
MKSGAELVGRANPTALFVGAVAAVSTIAIGIGLVIFATSGDSGGRGSDSSRAAANASSTTTTSSASSTTTTTAAPGGSGSTTTTTAAATSNGGASGGGAPEDPTRAYSDPEDPIYQGIPLPAGISATVGGCAWDAANGGELQASGTISASPDTDDAWFVTVIWLQNDRELDDQFELYEVAPGETKPWRLTTSAPLPPAEPFRCALEIE